MFATPQEDFWAGTFGEEYIERNQSDAALASNLRLFGRILERAAGVQSVIEFGANVGMNLQALRQLLPGTSLAAVEINAVAASRLHEIPNVEVFNESLLDFQAARQYDFAFTKGVLIHIDPDHLPTAYEVLHRHSRRYICVAEYYNPTPMTLTYRGHEGRLFKRDFAGELLDRYDDLQLVDYGFAYHRGPFPQDDVTWFLLEKKNA